MHIKDSMARRLIADLEALDLILVVDAEKPTSTKKLSDILDSSLSVKEAEKIQIELRNRRNEWLVEQYAV